MKKLVAVAILAALGACASNANNVRSAYVSPTQYANLDCNQIRLELIGISGRVATLSSDQNRKARNDAIAVGATVIFWPALFFLMSDDSKAELSQLKGQYDALNTVALAKKCDLANEAARTQ